VNFRDWQLYHQIHPLKLAIDVGVTPVALYLLWTHRLLPALLVAFVPPIVVSLAMIRWRPDLEALRQSALGRYIGKYMTPVVQAVRLLSLVPMAYGAWVHDFTFIVVGLVILALAWGNGLTRRVLSRRGR
jgi:hypothetical protein